MITKQFGDLDNDMVIYSFFIDRNLIVSDRVQLEGFALGMKTYTTA
jgi:hypothetical protein